MQSIFIIVNPTSAGGKTAQRWQAMADVLRASRIEFDFALTQSSQHATQLAKAAAEHGYTSVGCVGGDGTLNEVVNGLMQCELAQRPTLAMMPSGTGSDFARTMKLRGVSPVALLQHGAPVNVDVGVVSCVRNGANYTRYFVNVAGCGFDGDVALDVNRAAKRGGNLAYFASVFKVLRRYQNKRLRIRVQTGDANHDVEGEFNSVVIANGKYFGGGMNVAPMASVADGLLDVVLIGAVSRLEFVKTFPRIYSGTHISHPQIKMFTATEIQIEPLAPTQAAVLQAEGEWLGEAPAKIWVLPQALRVLQPR